jgi:hypothetical protein
MSILMILKLLGFILWPVLFLLPYFYSDKENFKQRLKQILTSSKDK